MNKYEEACKEFLKGCTCSTNGHPEKCKQCLATFLIHIKRLAIIDNYKEFDLYCID